MGKKYKKTKTRMFFWVILFFASYALFVSDTPKKLFRSIEDYYFFNYVPEESLLDYAKKPQFQRVVARDPRTSEDVIKYIADTVINAPKDIDKQEELDSEKTDVLYSLIENPNTGEKILKDIDKNIDNIDRAISCDIRRKLATREDLSRVLIKKLAESTDCGCEYILILAKKTELNNQDKLDILNQIVPDFKTYITISKDEEKCIISVLDEYSKVEKILFGDDAKTQKDIYNSLKFLFELYSFYSQKYNDSCKNTKTTKINDICLEFQKTISNEENLKKADIEFIKK